jgi:hypothetical protein
MLLVGPYPLDIGGGPLGSTFYAPNVLNNDPHGECAGNWGLCVEHGEGMAIQNAIQPLALTHNQRDFRARGRRGLHQQMTPFTKIIIMSAHRGFYNIYWLLPNHLDLFIANNILVTP